MEDKMKVIKKRLDDLKHPEKNVRIHSEQQIRELKRSLEKFGQTRALVVDENNVILIGNGLYEAMVSLGYQEASVYVKTELSENDKKKLMIADNKTYALGIDNLDTLNEFLEELQGDLDIPGYDEEILQQMVADADEVTEKISEYGTLDESEIQKIKEANEKREQKAAATEISDNNSENSSENPNTSDNQSSERQNTTETEPEITETRKFVICPNCGEKIWL
jgi:ParB-like chromosome segregation protein Spo0J